MSAKCNDGLEEFGRAMTAQDFCGPMAPWVDEVKWERFLVARCVTWTKGERDNRTDGEVHYVLEAGDVSYDLNTNGYDYRLPQWQAAIDWVQLHGDLDPHICMTCVHWTDVWDGGMRGSCPILTQARNHTGCRVYDDSDPIGTDAGFGCRHWAARRFVAY